MKKIQTLLYGIALILAGIACLLMESLEHSGIFELAGAILPILGLGVASVGFFSQEGSSKPEPKDESSHKRE